MGEKLDITAFPAEMRSTLDISADVKKDPEKVHDVEASDESSVDGGEVYDAGESRFFPIAPFAFV